MSFSHWYRVNARGLSSQFDSVFKGPLEKVKTPLYVKPWIIYEWMGNSTRHKVRNKALDNFDWLSKWLERKLGAETG